VARAIIERTRSDLTLTVVQRDLADALRRADGPGSSTLGEFPAGRRDERA
jgi:hypothetical protein